MNQSDFHLGRFSVSLLVKLFVTIAALLALSLTISANRTDAVSWNDGITSDVTYADGTTAHFDSRTFGMLSRGDRVVMTIPLPEDKMMSDRSLCFYLYHCCVTLRSRGETVASYGHELHEKGEMIGCSYMTLPIPDSAWGAPLELELDITEDNAIGQINEFMLYPTPYAYRFLLRGGLLGLIVSIAGMVVGAMALVLVFLVGQRNRGTLQALFLSLFMIIISFWIFCNAGLWELFGFPPRTFFWLEYLSLYCTQPPLLLYLYFSETNRRFRRILMVLTIVHLTLIAIATVLHFTNVLHYCSVLTQSHILIVIDGVFSFWIALRRVFNRRPAARYLLIGIAVMLLFAVLDVLRFNVNKYFVPLARFSTASILPIGLMVLLVFMIISYYSDSMQNLVDAETQRRLMQLAYVDALTGLASRSRLYELFAELDHMDAPEYTLLFFDMDRLKITNDTLGHDAGDNLLQIFSNILNRAFASSGTVARIGGDEFVVLVPSAAFDRKRALRRFYQYIDEENQIRKRRYPLSASYGCAISSVQQPLKTQDALRIADAALYLMKRSQAQERKAREMKD